jgi:hypothetical protein
MSASTTLAPFDASSAVPNGLELEWARGQARPALERIRSIRAFAEGTRAEVSLSRRVSGREHDETLAIETLTGTVVADEAPPWRPSPDRIARAVSTKAVDTHSLRAVSADGRLLFFLLGRNERESYDPDVGRLVNYDVTCALWDESEQTWRWDTSRSLPDLGVDTWLFEQARFDFTFDQSGITGRGSGITSSHAHDVATGAVRMLRPGDHVPKPAGIGDGIVLAADLARTLVLVARSTTVEVWNVVDDRVAASVDLAPLDDAPTAGAVLSSTGAVLVGTEHGRLLRFSLSRRPFVESSSVAR